MGVLCIYLLIGMLCAFLYGAIDRLGGNPFFAQNVAATGSRCLYFSFTTLTTVGYGDLTARTNLGHTLAVTEALVGQIYLVTVVALLVVGPGAAGARASKLIRFGRRGCRDAALASQPTWIASSVSSAGSRCTTSGRFAPPWPTRSCRGWMSRSKRWSGSAPSSASTPRRSPCASRSTGPTERGHGGRDRGRAARDRPRRGERPDGGRRAPSGARAGIRRRGLCQGVTMSILASQLEAARSQMAFTLGFHIILASMGVAFPAMMLIANYRGPAPRRRRRAAAGPALVEGGGGDVRGRRGDRDRAVVRVRPAVARVHRPLRRGLRRPVRDRGDLLLPRGDLRRDLHLRLEAAGAVDALLGRRADRDHGPRRGVLGRGGELVDEPAAGLLADERRRDEGRAAEGDLQPGGARTRCRT